MARVKVDIVMPDEGRKLNAAKVHKQRAVIAAIDAGALMVQGEAQRLILHGPKSGRVYVRGNIQHQASSPGEPPASDTGTLASSVQPDHILDTADAKETRVVARAKYAGFLEDGTRSVEPRPFMGRALAVKRKEIMAMVRRALQS